MVCAGADTLVGFGVELASAEWATFDMGSGRAAGFGGPMWESPFAEDSFDVSPTTSGRPETGPVDEEEPAPSELPPAAAVDA
mmetsp:Transcript_55835/g.181300  ORF Transcript_55835/g.181300 Transcript_55835/m.181300 type:complete len:82 (-) Transcript_55835:1382-1627(-)